MRVAALSKRARFAARAHSSSAITEAYLKILYISQYFPPEIAAPAARVSELSQHWVRAGHEVTVLTAFPNHPDGVVPLEYRCHFRKLVYRERMQGVNVARTWLLPFPNRKPYERMLNCTSFFGSAAIRGSLLDRPDVVIASSPQLLVGLSGWWLSRLNGVPLVLEIRDLWPESLVAVGVRNRQSKLYRLLARVASFLYRKAEHIVVVTPAFREYLIEKWRVPAEKISMVPNGVETQIFTPRTCDSNLRRSLTCEGKFIVSFIGTVGFAHGLDTLIAAAGKLQHERTDVQFMVVGAGADRERLMRLAHSQGVNNLRFIPQQPREKIPDYIAASDVCLVLLKKSEVFETVIPTKMLEFMSCGRPVVLGVQGQAREIVERSQAGICIPPEDAPALCEAILKLRDDPALRETLGKNGREYILRHLSREQTAIEYIDVLGQVMAGAPVPEAAIAT